MFDAAIGANGTAAVEYSISDGALSDSATVLISVVPCVSAPPDAPDVFLQTGYQQPIFVDLFAYARNGEIVQVGAPLGVPSGVYTPPAGENGNVSFTYVVRNACDVEDVGRVTIDVNQDPIGSPYLAQIGRTQQTVIPVSALASDAEPLAIIALEGAPSWVTVVDESRAILVDPAGRTGRVDLVAVVSDPGGLQVRVPVTIELVNLAPVANPDFIRADSGPVTFAPLANDTDPDGDTVALQSVPDTLTFPNGAVGSDPEPRRRPAARRSGRRARERHLRLQRDRPARAGLAGDHGHGDRQLAAHGAAGRRGDGGQQHRHRRRRGHRSRR